MLELDKINLLISYYDTVDGFHFLQILAINYKSMPLNVKVNNSEEVFNSSSGKILQSVSLN